MLGMIRVFDGGTVVEDDTVAESEPEFVVVPLPEGEYVLELDALFVLVKLRVCD